MQGGVAVCCQATLPTHISVLLACLKCSGQEEPLSPHRAHCFLGGLCSVIFCPPWDSKTSLCLIVLSLLLSLLAHHSLDSAAPFFPPRNTIFMPKVKMFNSGLFLSLCCKKPLLSHRQRIRGYVRQMGKAKVWGRGYDV